MRYSEITELDETFNDLGRLAPAQLKKGQPLAPDQADNFHEVGARVFKKVIAQIQTNDFAKLNAGLPSKGLHTLEIYSIADYSGMRCFIGNNNSSGFALNGGELVSVFSSQRSSGHAIVAEAVRLGARRLDCFALREDNALTGPLFKLYTAAGFILDTSKNEGTPGEPYAIVQGVSDYVDDAGDVQSNDPRVVVFMRRP